MTAAGKYYKVKVKQLTKSEATEFVSKLTVDQILILYALLTNFEQNQ